MIVVVIIGVLAALVIPRMIASPEKAKIGEAYQMIGALNRAQQARMDTIGSPTPIYFGCSDPPGPCNQSTVLSSLGMADILQKNFRYECGTWSGYYYCVAYRYPMVAGLYPYITHYFTGPDADKWQCGQGYVGIDTGVAGWSTQGCKADW